MSDVKNSITKGFVEVSELAKIVYEMAKDIETLKSAIVNHQHVENADVVYTQSATVAKTATTVTLLTKVVD